MTRQQVISVRDLVIEAGPAHAPNRLVDGVSFDIHPGEAVALVGESGSGKSMTVLAAMGLLPRGVRVTGGSVRLGDLDLLTADDRSLRAVRGADLAMVFQDPMMSLNPVMRVYTQMAEMIGLHAGGLTKDEVRSRCLELLESVHMPDPERTLRSYPHELSGGQRQRVMIAMAMAHDPRMLIADEPTTALDVTVQAQVMRVMQEVRERVGSSLVLVTHDLGLVAENADRVLVMYRGKLVEQGTTLEIFRSPREEYTRRLLSAVLALGDGRVAGKAAPLPDTKRSRPVVDVEDVHVHYPIRNSWRSKPEQFRAVDGVTLRLDKGVTIGLVGESGCGKSTLVKTILGIQKPTSGAVYVHGRDVTRLSDRARRPLRRAVQAVFQDPYSSLDPRLTVHEIVAEPLRIDKCYSPARVAEVLDQVGLTTAMARRRPAEFSGGQRQRIGIARALALRPEALILDEPTSALDVSIQAQVLDLLRDLQRELGLAYLFVSHDLAVVRSLADEVAVMRRGRFVEYGPAEQVFGDPQHEYTRMLLDSAPVPDPSRRAVRRADEVAVA
ncbi:ABC transporter ATP-binding protein [Nocardia jinanensis]|uniref:ABC transporter ATP-binding protein n=1 Tax=Nocardia jinanensis TaxID=382504 RepID=A0A917RDH6_9NOCA|nr:ABC transporter ATP-binding protein [Nocardia jinanensis]GGL02360.1 ABC transporter ATP-binding protein [Nocardia jinanensis]